MRPEIKEIKHDLTGEDPLLPLLLPLYAASKHYLSQYLSELLLNGDILRLMQDLKIAWGRSTLMGHSELLNHAAKALEFYRQLEAYIKKTQVDEQTKWKMLQKAFIHNDFEFKAEIIPALERPRNELESKMVEYKKVKDSKEQKQETIKISKKVIQESLARYDANKRTRRRLITFVNDTFGSEFSSADSKVIKKIKSFDLGKDDILPLELLLPFMNVLTETKAKEKNRQSKICIKEISEHIQNQTGLTVLDFKDTLENLTSFKLLSSEALAALCPKIATRSKQISLQNFSLEKILRKLSFCGMLTIENVSLIYDKITRWVEFSQLFDLPKRDPRSKDLIAFAICYLHSVNEFSYNKFAEISNKFSTPTLRVLATLKKNAFQIVISILLDIFPKISSTKQEAFASMIVKTIPNQFPESTVSKIAKVLFSLDSNQLFDKLITFIDRNPWINLDKIINTLERSNTGLPLVKEHFDIFLNFAALIDYPQNINLFKELLDIFTVELPKLDTDHLRSFSILSNLCINPASSKDLYCSLSKVTGVTALTVTQTLERFGRYSLPNTASNLMRDELPTLIEKFSPLKFSAIELSSGIQCLLYLTQPHLNNYFASKKIFYFEIILTYQDLPSLARALFCLKLTDINPEVFNLFFSHLCKKPEDASIIADVLEIIHHSHARNFILVTNGLKDILSLLLELPQSMVFLSKCLVLLGDACLWNIRPQLLLDLGEHAYSFSYGIGFLNKNLNKEFIQNKKIILINLLKKCAPYAMSLTHLICHLLVLEISGFDLTNQNTLDRLQECAPRAFQLNKFIETISHARLELLTIKNIEKLSTLSTDSLTVLENRFLVLCKDARIQYFLTPGIFEEMITLLPHLANFETIFKELYQIDLEEKELIKQLRVAYSKFRNNSLVAFLPGRKDFQPDYKKDKQSAISSCFWNYKPLYARQLVKIIADLAFPKEPDAQKKTLN